MRVSVIFTNPLDFFAFYHKGLPRFYLNLPFSNPSSLSDNEASIADESDAEAKMVTILDIAEEDLAVFKSVTQSFRGQIVSSDELDAMGI